MDCDRLGVSRLEGEIPAAGLRQIADGDIGVAGIGQRHLRFRARPASKTDASEAVNPVVLAGLAGGSDLPARCFQFHPGVAVPGPGFGDQQEAVAGVAEPRLQKTPDVRCDGVRCGG